VLLLILLSQHCIQIAQKQMSEDNINKLIQELKGLQVQEQRILAALEQAYIERTIKGVNEPTASQLATIPLSVTNIVALARATDPIPQFRKGDCVVIVNKIRRPISRPANSGDRTAIVLKVHILTELILRQQTVQ
jgi:ribosomal protein L12E/L44/L45/RPP1/RPP2